MKLEDMVMVVEKQNGKETNFLLSFADYMGEALGIWGGYAEDMAGAVSALYGTKEGKSDWSDLYISATKGIRVAFCKSESQLRVFLLGVYNEGVWSFDADRCSQGCLDVLRIYNMKPDGKPLFPYLHYECLEHSFHAGEVLHNMNGNNYRVLAVLSPQNLLLMGVENGQVIVGNGVQLYERYPKGERPDNGSMVTGVEWGHGVYLGNDITMVDFDIIKQEYGVPDKVEDISGLREKLRRDFWMQKNVELKEGLPKRVRNAARVCIVDAFGTSEPDVFAEMLDKGMYDRKYDAREGQKKITGQVR